jgi:hypothetical protein
MKKFTLVSLAIFLLFGFIPQVSADTSVINLVSKPHQLFDGTFFNDDLAKDLSPFGSLGKAVEQKRTKARTWIIDAALLDEVADMANGYVLENEAAPTGELIAKEWMARLLLATSGDQIIVLPYGNPDVELAKKLAPSELRFYSEYAYERVAFHLNRRIAEESSENWSKGDSVLSTSLRKKYTQNRRVLTTLSSVVNAPELQAQRAKLAILLSPTFDEDEQRVFSFNADTSVADTLNRLRITGGKYQIASKTGDLPVTVINDFSVPVTVNIKFKASNSRLQVSNILGLQIPANSRAQLAMPFSVIAPGATTVIAQITNADGEVIGKSSKLAINLTIFDSKVTGFTIGAAVLLFIAALTQTIRRVRRGRNEKQ